LFVIGTFSRKDRTMPASDNIHARVAKVLVQALGVEEDELNPSATLQGDLGAESIDFLDIVFRLEREFGIRIPRGELFPDPVSPDDPAFVRDDRITDEYLAALRSRMPYADLSDLERDRRLSRFNDLFTVGLLVSYVRWQLGKVGQAGSGVQTPDLVASGMGPR
jgi:acyl carrier protein